MGYNFTQGWVLRVTKRGLEMANKGQRARLKQGVTKWNQWRREHTNIILDLSNARLSNARLSNANLCEVNLNNANLSFADLSNTDLSFADLSNANLFGADLSFADLYRARLSNTNLIGTNLSEVRLSFANLCFADLSNTDLSKVNLNNANLSFADLRGANLSFADFTRADLSSARLSFADLSRANLSNVILRGADLKEANLTGADLTDANLTGADLTGANLGRATLVGTKLTGANLNNCNIYGIAVWNVKLEGARQENLVITPDEEPTITVDNLRIAQFIYLLLNNQDIRDVIDTITSKMVLILGQFSSERKIVLDAIKDELRKHNYLPILFDFEKPANRDITETVSTLAHLARFVVADITEPKSIPQELSHIIPFLPSVPIVPLLRASEREYGMYEHFPRYPWVLPLYRYNDVDEAIHSIKKNIINPAEQKAKELNQN